jgi:hypothetical protein
VCLTIVGHYNQDFARLFLGQTGRPIQ